RLRRLLHDLAELAGHHEIPLAGHHLRLDGENLAAIRRPRQAYGDADLVNLIALGFAREFRRPEILDDVLVRDLDGPRRTLLRHPPRDLAEDLRDLPLELAQPRLARVLADDRAQRRRAELSEADAQAVLLDLLGNDVAARDVDLLLLGVSSQADDFHAVAQRRGDRIDHVGRADEEHARQIK